MSKLTPIHAGFMPLLDSAILIAASEFGFAREEGIDLKLVKETSWANIRDRMAVGHFEVAHMLAPIPLASKVGLTPMPLDIIAPMALGLGGNAVTVRPEIAEQMEQFDIDGQVGAALAGQSLAKVVADRKQKGLPKLVFAVVHPHSGHNYELRYWLAASGINPEHDVEIVIVPPPLMPDALEAQTIDGFCVGEPWNSVAVSNKSGVMITTKSDIWRSSPEKVLAVSREFGDHNEETLLALIRALVKAAQWCGVKSNHYDLAQTLAKPEYVGTPINTIMPSLNGQFVDRLGSVRRIDDFFIPFARAATFPWRSHALWFYSQMVRWQQVEWDETKIEDLQGAYRPDLYRKAIEGLDIPVPSASAKVEGALSSTISVGAGKNELRLGPDGFFDGHIFDPNEINAYILAQVVK